MSATRSSHISLHDRLYGNFNSREWRAGLKDYELKLVSGLTLTGNTISAQVHSSGETPHQVSIRFQAVEDDTAEPSCTCQTFADDRVCKHLAALIYAADAAGLQQVATGNWDLDLVQYVDDDNEYGIFDDGEDDDDDEMNGWNQVSPSLPSFLRIPNSSPAEPIWHLQLKKIQQTTDSIRPQTMPPVGNLSHRSRRLMFVLDITRSINDGRPILTIFYQEMLKNGGWSVLKQPARTVAELLGLLNQQDQELLKMLVGNEVQDEYSLNSSWLYRRIARVALSPQNSFTILPRLCEADRLGIASSMDRQPRDFQMATWDAGPPWRFTLDWSQDERQNWVAQGQLRRTLPTGEVESLSLPDLVLVFSSGLLVTRTCLTQLEEGSTGLLGWIRQLRFDTRIVVPQAEAQQFARTFYQACPTAQLDLPPELAWQTEQVLPTPKVIINAPDKNGGPALGASASFIYGEQEIAADSPARSLLVDEQRRVILRNPAEEARRIDELLSAGFHMPAHARKDHGLLEISPKQLCSAVEQLMARDWAVKAEGHSLRPSGNFNISVTSGVDWFDLTVNCEFDGLKAALPELHSAIARGDRFVTLGDGSRGILPEDWLKKYAPLAELGETAGDSLRFLPSQAMILDALLAAQPDVNLDAKFQATRDRLQSFDGVKPLKEPAAFRGTLREYQREGLGWLNFLREFKFGGCLADDMGLGKTIQVLALLLKCHKNQQATAPSLVVAPKSLVFNWIDEAARFTPQLRVLNHTGIDRRPIAEAAAEHDLVLTTYGTLLRDITTLSQIPFHYAILDEAQAIKNANSQSAKAARLLQAEHRLAMTGTPVENHLGDLWSIFEFLNPGMLGRSSQLSLFTGQGKNDPESLGLLGKALRPFLLRRTKEQVLKDLPEKTEQTLYCDLEPRQRKLYDELKEHYRALLTRKIQEDGLAKSKIHVLEALLRLRQAACHPALVDKSKVKLSSAKLETLMEQLQEITAEGHKVLVFSQFTSLLELVKPRLKAKRIAFEYLDGKTTGRKEIVERFQSKDGSPVFLISLKAGGSGLNLTAADYVFILDPWWNPAVEMQAVDRAHRIGQTKPVFAYRLIARDTVEEKILKLQSQKRDLAEAIISADKNLLRTLTAEDLQMLLS